MSMSLDYVGVKTAMAAKLAREDKIKEAVEELAIGVAYLADYLRKGEGPRSSGEQPEREG